LEHLKTKLVMHLNDLTHDCLLDALIDCRDDTGAETGNWEY
jgi:hypothetical protein